MFWYRMWTGESRTRPWIIPKASTVELTPSTRGSPAATSEPKTSSSTTTVSGRARSSARRESWALNWFKS